MTSALFLLAGCFALGQIAYPEQEISVQVPSVTARSAHAADVLAASLEIIFRDKDICCGKNSALEDSVDSADPKLLKNVADRLQGRHRLSDGRAITVTEEYLTADQINAGHLIYMLTSKQTPLMMWNSHLYVVCGVTYVGDVDTTTNARTYAVHKILLQDARFSDSRREVSFDRLTDDTAKVEGLLFLRAVPQ